MRLRRVEEIAPVQAIARNGAWIEHLAGTGHIPVATHDLLWADAVVFGTPARFGNVASQLKQFLDTLSGLWMRDRLADKVYSGFTSTASAHGGQESTPPALYNSGGNPYGASHVTGDDGSIAVDDPASTAARSHGHRVATMAAALKHGLTAA